jgi:hypothetical protein
LDNKKISFMASFPPISSAMKIDGQGGGARIQIDIPGSELEAIIRLQALCGKTFTVTVEDNQDNNLKDNKVKYIK